MEENAECLAVVQSGSYNQHEPSRLKTRVHKGIPDAMRRSAWNAMIKMPQCVTNVFDFLTSRFYLALFAHRHVDFLIRSPCLSRGFFVGTRYASIIYTSSSQTGSMMAPKPQMRLEALMLTFTRLSPSMAAWPPVPLRVKWA